jgi:hypothetical protein
MRPKPITPRKREDIIARLAAGLVEAYRYFRWAERSLSAWFGREIQEVLRRRDGELTNCRN